MNLKKLSNIPLYLSAVISIITAVCIPIGELGLIDINSKPMGVLCLLLLIVLTIQYRLYKKPVICLLGLFMLWMCITALFSGNDIPDAFGGKIQRSWYLCLLGFFTARLLSADLRKKWFVTLISASLFTNTFIGICGLINATKNLLDSDYVTTMGSGLIKNGRLHIFGNANTLGMVVCVSVLEAVWLIVFILQNKKYRYSAAAPGLALIFNFVLLSLCRSRGAILAIIFSLSAGAFVVVWSAVKKGKENLSKRDFLFKHLLGFGTVLLVTVCTLVLVYIPKQVYDSCVESAVQNDKISETLTPYGYDYALENLSDRTLIWDATFRMMDEKPSVWLTGITTCNVHPNQIYNVYEGRPELTAYYSHSGYVEALLEYGTVGGAILLALLIYLIGAGLFAAFSAKGLMPDDRIIFIFALSGLVFGVVEVIPLPYSTLRGITYLFFVSCGCISGIYNSFKTEAVSEKVNSIRSVSGHEIKLPALKRLYMAASAVAFCVIMVFGIIKYTAASAGITAEQNTKTPAESFNSSNRKMLSASGVDFALEDISDVFNGGILKEFINSTSIYPADYEGYTVDARTTTKEYWDKLFENLDLDNLPRAVDTEFGFSVVRGSLKRCPTDDSIYLSDSNSVNLTDENLQSDLLPFMPVVQLHSSLDGEWVYVLTYGYGGWTRKENIALCENKEDWIIRSNPEQFIVVTDYEIFLSGCEVLKDISIPMGTRLTLAENGTVGNASGGAPEYAYARGECFTVTIPTRSESGYITDITVTVPADERVNRGYLTYTEENLRSLALRHLDKPYGWAGQNNAFDCSGFTRSIFACFGYELPRTAAAQANVAGAEVFSVRNDWGLGKVFNVGRNTVDHKLEILKSAPAGTLLYFPGHIMMYLGMENDVPMCISSVGDYSTRDLPVGTIVSVNKTVITDMTYITRANGKSWLENLEKIVIIR